MTDSQDLWALWPDDFMCPVGEVTEFTHRSDDYSVVIVTEYDEVGNPNEWVRK